MSTLVQPARCLLSDDQLAAALALAGVALPADSPLPRTAPPADAAGALRGTPLLEGGQISEDWRGALQVLAAPDHVVSIASGIAGAPEWATCVISCGSGDGPFVAHPGDGRHDLALLPTPVDAVLYADELLEITAGPSGEGDEAIALSPAGLAALGAFADALQRTRLQALLDRSLERREAWSTTEIERQVVDGGTHEDTRWATTAIRHAAPVALPGDGPAVAGGVAELERGGVVTRQGEMWTLTAAGRRRAEAFGQLVNIGAMSRAALDASGAPDSSSASVFRTVSGVWLITWNVVDGEVVAALEETTAGQVLEVVWAMLRPRDAATPAATPAMSPPACASCGAAIRVGARFCTSCGRPVA